MSGADDFDHAKDQVAAMALANSFWKCSRMPIRPEMLARYPKDWKLRSRFVRFYRARNRCEWCGAENYQPHPITGSKVVLTTAHVWDMRPEACSLLNLAALCQRCHNRWDAPYRKRNRARRNGQMEMVL